MVMAFCVELRVFTSIFWRLLKSFCSVSVSFTCQISGSPECLLRAFGSCLQHYETTVQLLNVFNPRFTIYLCQSYNYEIIIIIKMWQRNIFIFNNVLSVCSINLLIYLIISFTYTVLQNRLWFFCNYLKKLYLVMFKHVSPTVQMKQLDS